MQIYFDTCALNRLTDDLSQPRIRAEAKAVAHILDLVFSGQLRWVASTVLQQEIERNPHPIRRIDTLRVLSQAGELIAPTEESVRNALSYTNESLSRADALHLAVAQQANVDILITTDDAFIKRAQARLRILRPELLNPVDLLKRRHPWLLPNPSSPAI